MSNSLLSVGAPYPLPLSGPEGAAAHFLGKGGSLLQVVMPNLLESEIKALRKGNMTMGLIVDQPLLLFIVSFQYKGDSPLIMECPFDARLIPRDSLDLHDVTTQVQRLMIQVHIVDSATGVLKGLRGITLAPGLTRDFMSAVQDQLANSGSVEPLLARYMQLTPDALAKKANMLPCGHP